MNRVSSLLGQTTCAQMWAVGCLVFPSETLLSNVLVTAYFKTSRAVLWQNILSCHLYGMVGH